MVEDRLTALTKAWSDIALSGREAESSFDVVLSDKARSGISIGQPVDDRGMLVLILKRSLLF